MSLSPTPKKESKQSQSQASSEPDKKTTISSFLWMLAALLLMFGVLAFSTAIPLLAAGLDQKDISPESNPLGFGSFLTGVITLGGLYYAIEADDGQKFQHDAGEALQNISAVAIFLMGCLNFIWEYLSNLNKLVWNVDFLEANPPVWPLILTFAKPKVLSLIHI